MSKSVEICRITPELPEFKDVLRLRWEQLDQAYNIPLPTEPSSSDRSRAAIHIGAFQDERIVGTVRIEPDKDNNEVALVRRMAVAPDMRRRGIGKAVLALAEKTIVIEQAVTEVRLNVEATIDGEPNDAINFYEALGYSLTGTEYRWPPKEDGVLHYEMTKALSRLKLE